MLRTRVVWTGVAGTPWYSNFFWAGDDAAEAQAAQDQTIAWLAAIKGLVTTAVTGTAQPEVTRITESTGVMTDIYDVSASVSQGTNIGEPLPYQIQVLTKLSTEIIRNGRRVSGRCFVGGLCETNQTNGVGPDEVIREAVQECFTDVLLDGTANLVVWSRPVDGGPAGTTSLVTGAQTNAVWSSLRTRRAAA